MVAGEDSRVMQFDETTLWCLVEASHHVARNLLFVLSRRLRHGNKVILKSQKLQQEYQRYATIDALTGVFNRRWLDEMLTRQLKRFKSGGGLFSLLLIDVDSFKSYNDTHGHVAADRALHTIAVTLGSTTRPGDMIARYGGDEFVVLLPGIDVSSSRKMGQRLIQAIGKAKIQSLDGTPLPPGDHFNWSRSDESHRHARILCGRCQYSPLQGQARRRQPGQYQRALRKFSTVSRYRSGSMR